MGPEKWFNFENRYIVSLVAHPWTKGENIFSINSFNRFMLAHGATEIGRGIMGILHAGYKIFQAIALVHTSEATLDSDQDVTKAFKRSKTQHHNKTKSFPSQDNIRSSERQSLSTDWDVQDSSKEDVPSSKKEKVKKRPGKKSRKPQTDKKKNSSINLDQNTSPSRDTVPDSFKDVLTIHNTLSESKFSKVCQDLQNLGVKVRQRGNNLMFQCESKTLTVHLNHHPGKGAAELSNGRLSSLRNFIRAVRFIARQPQTATTITQGKK